MGRLTARAVLPLVSALLLAACAGGGSAPPGGAAPQPATTPSTGTAPATASPADDSVVLRVTRGGGLMPMPEGAALLPVVSVYRDGRVITEGPEPLSSPRQALPAVQVRSIPPALVASLVERAVQAGVADTSDLGRPGVADAPTTRFTVVTDRGTLVRRVYALAEAGPQRPEPPDPREPAPRPWAVGLSSEQQAARARLQELETALSSPERTFGGRAVGEPQPYRPQAVAALVTPFPEGGTGASSPGASWPGPPLPGEPLAGGPRLHCLSASGEAAQRVLAAARTASVRTPWTSDDGRRWSVAFRPLLPDEHGCADLRTS